MNKIEELRDKSRDNKIPIMLEDGLDFLLEFIKENNIKKILEIGTAVGYSSIKMALLNKDIKITTIERDKSRYNEAISNIKDFSLESQIHAILSDALDVNIDEKYDLIFIDAAKGKNIDFFEKFKNNLKSCGFIITDNLKFHGYVDMEISEIDSRNIRGLVRKIRNYIKFLENNEEFETIFYDIGDGVSISRRKNLNEKM